MFSIDTKQRNNIYYELNIFLTSTTLPFDNFLLPNILKHLCENKIQSLLVEGGTHLLQSFIDQNLWNEAIIYNSKNELGEGVRAPVLDVADHIQTELGDNTVLQLYNRV